MKKAKISYFPIDGSGVLHLDFVKGLFGEATEALKGDGVGFFDAHQNLLGVTFDDVAFDGGKQTLVFKDLSIEIRSAKGKIVFTIIPKAKKNPAA